MSIEELQIGAMSLDEGGEEEDDGEDEE